MISNLALQRVDEHWAVLAVGEAERDRGLNLANARLLRRAVGQQLNLDFQFHPSDEDLLERLANAYEMAAIEGLHLLSDPGNQNDELRAQCVAGAWRAFELYRLLDIPHSAPERILHVLHVSSLAYCGDRWSDLRRWYADHDADIEAPSAADTPWDRRLLHRIYDCWLRLFRKDGWDDIDRIREIVAGLREDQRQYEAQSLNSGSAAANQSMALRLIAMYHWAKATEVLAVYMLQGNPPEVNIVLQRHFEQAIKAAATGMDADFEILLRWLASASRQMVGGSLWWATRGVNSKVSEFVANSTKQGLFELLPPQRAALLEEGLLDTSKTAVVVEMPTSGGKTLLAEFRILQALNQFRDGGGWIAYVAPTRALTAQVTRRLRRDFEPIGIEVEQLSGAVEVDTFEEDLLSNRTEGNSFDVLVTTPEKLQLVIRNKKIARPLALLVLDEAHNIENESRGLRIELLLATVKRECANANFLLLMPFVPNADQLARWLADDISAGRAISIGSTPWQPNERVVGMFRAEPDDSIRAGWRMRFKTLTTTPKTIHLCGDHTVGSAKPLDIPKSSVVGRKGQKGAGLQAAAMAKILSSRGTSIAVSRSPRDAWSVAREVLKSMEPFDELSDNVKLVQQFLRTEISPDFELVSMLERGIGVHHAGLSDETRALVEWLAEEGELRVLCATSTIAQGINFPVSSVFLASRFVPKGRRSVEMSARDFWNLAGRAGRIGHDSVGIVGLAEGDNPEEIMRFVGRQTGDLASRLIELVRELTGLAEHDLQIVVRGDQWEAFRCYVAHLLNEKRNLNAVLAETENLLRNTLGYSILRNTQSSQAAKLLSATRNYAQSLSNDMGSVAIADATGFSPEGVRHALAGMRGLENRLVPSDWSAERLFGEGRGLSDLFGVMLRVPQLQNLTDIAGEGLGHQRLAEVASAWVGGASISSIAREYFQADGIDQTRAISDACKAIYRTLANSGTWGLAALSQMCGFDYESLSEAARRRINSLPAMIYHGVKTEEGVLMRMNAVPRSVAESIGAAFAREKGEAVGTVQEGRRFVRALSDRDWDVLRPPAAHMTGAQYRRVWKLLSGESR